MNGHYYKLSYHALLGRASLIILIMTGFTKNSELLNNRWSHVSILKRLRLAFTLLLGIIFAGGCVQLAPLPTLSIVPATDPPTNAPSLISTPSFPWTDENAVMSGVCFEAALDAAGKLFVIRDSQAHIQFYDLADNSHLCRRPLVRYPFDFSNGRVLAGLWSYGRGCTARHEVLSIGRDDSAKSLLIQLRFVIEGTCDYELIRPFWIGLEGVNDYAIDIRVE
jgi:hypothetical protein